MKILTVVGNLGVGGTQRVAQNLSLGLASCGVDVSVLAYGGGGLREAACRDGGLRLFVGSAGGQDAIEAARRWNPDIIHIHRTGYANAEEIKILRHLRSAHAKIVETNVFGRFDWSKGSQIIDAHCLLSKWCAFKWNAWGGYASDKRSFILPNAVDASSIKLVSEPERQRFRTSLGIPANRFMFGRVGQPMIAKWSTKILDVFQKALLRHDIGLLLVGTPPEILNEIRLLPDDVRTRIISIPLVTSDERLSALIGAMDGFLHISQIGESFGMVLCEAMLGGVPVVTLSTPLRDNSQLEVVGHEKGGLIALTLDAIPEAMTRLIRDEPFRQAVKTGGRAWVEKRFGVDTVSLKAISIYQSLLSGGGANRQESDDAPPDKIWIQGMLSNGIGRRPTPVVKLAFELLHVPLVYRLYLATKSRK